MQEKEILWESGCGRLRGLENERCRMFLGLPFAHAGRFEYAGPADSWEGELDATRYGPGCPQNRAWHEHLEHPTRLFYHREFREGQSFRYDEDCLNLNLYVPKETKNAPVIIFFYGGGFDSGLNCEGPFDGSALAERGIVTAFANYRVGPLGYLTHAELKAAVGREGNFGLDDQLCAIRWVKAHIRDFGGDPDNITLMGQSAGAISIQYLCLNHDNEGLFRRVVMMSGAGLFPKFSLPRPAEETRAYWEQYIEAAGCRSLEELRHASLDTLFEAVEKMKSLRSDGIYYTMPVIDGVLLKGRVDELIKKPLAVDTMIGYTNTDLYAPVMAWIGNRYGSRNRAYVYFFDIDAPGDDNRAFHSSDLRYMLGTLDGSWRPYGARDHRASEELLDGLANFARRGDPNGEGLPLWRAAKPGLRTAVLRIGPKDSKMGHAPYGRLLKNFLTKGEPKA